MPGGMQQDATATDTTTSTDTTAAPATGNDQPQMTGGGMALSPIVAAKMLKSLDSITQYDPNWTLADFPFTTVSCDAMRPMPAIFDATNPDLGPFHKSGGTLIQRHGRQDPISRP